MCEILFGKEFVAENTVCTCLINANSPLVWDSTMLGAAEVYARANQACIITPFILSGAMSPVTVAGTLTQVLAEVMAGTAFCQLVRPGAPVIFGTFVSTLSMQSGAPTFGTPEAALAIYGAGQLARRMNMPFRTGGSLCASKIPDAQAAYESAQTLLPTMFAGANFVLHAAGWIEGGLSASYEKFIMDFDQLGAHARARQGRRHQRERPGDGGVPSGRAGRSFPRLRAHPGQFRNRLLSLQRRRQQFGRAMEGRGLEGRGDPRQRDLEKDARPNTRRRRSILASTRRCAPLSRAGRRRCRTRIIE